MIGKREALLEELRKELRGLQASLVQAVNSNLAALDLQAPGAAASASAASAVAVPVGGGGAASSGGPRMGLDGGGEEKTEGVYL